MQRLRNAADYVAGMFRSGSSSSGGASAPDDSDDSAAIEARRNAEVDYYRRQLRARGKERSAIEDYAQTTREAQSQDYFTSIGFANEDLTDEKLVALDREIRNGLRRWYSRLGPHLQRYHFTGVSDPNEFRVAERTTILPNNQYPPVRSLSNPVSNPRENPPAVSVYLPVLLGGSPTQSPVREIEGVPFGEVVTEEEAAAAPAPTRPASPPGVRIKPSAKSKDTSVTIELVPSVFRGADREGDFKWMINRPEWQDALFVFNDNEAQFEAFRAGKEGGFTTGGGNAAIRPYRRLKPPRSAGIPTGPLPGGAGATDGYTSLSVHNKRVIDAAIGVIRELLASGKYKRVVYSAKDEATGELGSGIFNVAPEVKRYIVERLRATVEQANREAGKKLDERLAEKARGGGKPAAPVPEPTPAPKQKKPAARKKPAAAAVAGPAKVTFSEFLEAVERAYKNEDRTRWREYAELANTKSDEEWLAWLETFVSDVQEGPRSAENLRRRIVEIHARDVANAYQKAINEVENTPLPPPDVEEETEPIERFPPPPSSEKPPRESPTRVVTPPAPPAPAPPQPAPAPAPQPPPPAITSLNDVIMRDPLPPSRERLEEEEAERQERRRLEKNARRAARRREERAKKKEREKEDYVDALSALISLQENPSKRGRGGGSVGGELVPVSKRPRGGSPPLLEPRIPGLLRIDELAALSESGPQPILHRPLETPQWYRDMPTVRQRVHESASEVAQMALKIKPDDPSTLHPRLVAYILGEIPNAENIKALQKKALDKITKEGWLGSYDAKGKPLKTLADLAQAIYSQLHRLIGDQVDTLAQKGLSESHPTATYLGLAGLDASTPAPVSSQPSPAETRRLVRESQEILANPDTPPIDSEEFRRRYRLLWIGGPGSWIDPETWRPFPLNTAIVIDPRRELPRSLTTPPVPLPSPASSDANMSDEASTASPPAADNAAMDVPWDVWLRPALTPWQRAGRDAVSFLRLTRRGSEEMQPVAPQVPLAPFVPPLYLRVPLPPPRRRVRVTELPVVEDTSRALVPYSAVSSRPPPATPAAPPRAPPPPGSPTLADSVSAIRARIAAAMESSRAGILEAAEREAARRLRVYQERILAGDGSGASAPPTRLELAIWEKLAEKVRAEAFLTEETFDSADAPGYSRAVQSALLARIMLRIQSLEEDIKGAEAAAAAPPRPPHTADEPAPSSSSPIAPPPLPPLFEHHPEDLVAEFGAEEAPPFVEAPPGPAPEALPLPEELGLGVAPAPPPPVLPVVEASGPPEVAWLGGDDGGGYVSIRSANEDDRRIFSNGEEEDSPDYEQTRLEAGVTYLLGDNIEELKRRILRDDGGGEPRTFVVLTREDYPEEYRVLSHRKMLWERDHAATEEVEEEPAAVLPPPELPPPLLDFEPEVLDELAPRIRLLSTVPHARRVRTDVDPATLYPMPILSDAEARGIVGGVRRSARLAAKRERMARMEAERRAAEREAPPPPPRKRARKSRK